MLIPSVPAKMLHVVFLISKFYEGLQRCAFGIILERVKKSTTNLYKKSLLKKDTRNRVNQ